MRVVSFKNQVLHIEFPNRKELTMTMGRPQEFYESAHKNLRNKVFDLEQFIDTFTDEEGDVNYYNAWSGFNIPGSKLNSFFGKFDITRRELRLAHLVGSYVRSLHTKSKYYLIATMIGDQRSLDHELVHAAFYLNKEYKEKASALVAALPADFKTHFNSVLTEMGYHKSVIVDEINAYLSTMEPTELSYRVQDIYCPNPARSDISLLTEMCKPFVELVSTILPNLRTEVSN